MSTFFNLTKDLHMPLGMQSGEIPDDHIEACCSFQPHFGPQNARINKGTSWTTCRGQCINDTWIQARFDRPVAVSGIQTRGQGDKDHWVTRFDLMLGLNLTAISSFQWIENCVCRHLYNANSFQMIQIGLFLMNATFLRNSIQSRPRFKELF